MSTFVCADNSKPCTIIPLTFSRHLSHRPWFDHSCCPNIGDGSCVCIDSNWGGELCDEPQGDYYAVSAVLSGREDTPLILNLNASLSRGFQFPAGGTTSVTVVDVSALKGCLYTYRGSEVEGGTTEYVGDLIYNSSFSSAFSGSSLPFEVQDASYRLVYVPPLNEYSVTDSVVFAALTFAATVTFQLSSVAPIQSQARIDLIVKAVNDAPVLLQPSPLSIIETEDNLVWVDLRSKVIEVDGQQLYMYVDVPAKGKMFQVSETFMRSVQIVSNNTRVANRYALYAFFFVCPHTGQYRVSTHFACHASTHCLLKGTSQ